MGVLAQTKHLDFFGTACGTIIFAEALAQLFPAFWEGGTGHCSAYLSRMSMQGILKVSITVPLTSSLTCWESVV
jgi:hypothetical protein